MLCARELKKAGQEVLLLDKSELGSESSWAGGGILSPLHPWRYPDEVGRLASLGHKWYPQVADELYREGGTDPEYVRSGLLVLNSDEQEQAKAWAEKWHVKLSVLEGVEAIQSVAPGVSQAYQQAIWMPDIAQMRNPRLVKAARASLDYLGINYHEQMRVESLNITDNKISGVVANGKTYSAKQVLIAGGAWSAQILKQCTQVPEIHPVKGQMICFKGEPGLLNRILLDDNRYIIPRKDGHILCGSSIEHVGFDKSTSLEIKQQLLASAIEIFPQLDQLNIEYHWAGLRPGSPDGVPFVGRHAEVDGLYVNSGHFRNGVILGIGSCRQVVAQMLKDV